jgi:hypothetical protein
LAQEPLILPYLLIRDHPRKSAVSPSCFFLRDPAVRRGFPITRDSGDPGDPGDFP